MAQNSNRPGLHGGNNTGGNNTPGKQRLIIAPSNPAPPPAPPAPPAPPVPSSGWHWRNMLGWPRALWDNKKKIAIYSALGITGLTTLYSTFEIESERPQIKLNSYNGVSSIAQRTWSNMFDRVLPTMWDYSLGALGKGLMKLNPVPTRYRPFDYAVVCKDTSLIQQINNGDAQAIAFDKSIRLQLDRELHLLSTVDAPFYRQHAHYNPERQAAIAKFTIPDVSASFKYGSGLFVLKSPTPLSEWQIERAGGPCDENETFVREPIPRLQKATPE